MTTPREDAIANSICVCGLAKSYHDGRLASRDEYRPRYPGGHYLDLDSPEAAERLAAVGIAVWGWHESRASQYAADFLAALREQGR